MNVLIVNASPRKNGITTGLLAEAERTITQRTMSMLSEYTI